MDDNDNCVIVKRKEYDELVKLANSKKGDKLLLDLDIDTRYKYLNVYGELDLSRTLFKQIRRILLRVEDRLGERIANMSRSERRKYLKQYKTK
jgi:hypothetical protein